MNYPYFIVDAFSDVAFGGVPVAVFPDADTIPPAYLKALSEEIVATNSVFIQKSNEAYRYAFEFFNEKGRCLPAAHTLIAGLSVLHYRGELQNIDANQSLRIETTEDCIEAYVDSRTKKFPYLLKQSFTPVIDNFVPQNEEIAKIIGLNEHDITNTQYKNLIVSNPKAYLLVPLKSYHALHEANIDKSAWSASSLPASLVDKIILFAPNNDPSGADFHLRLLRKDDAVDFDPAIGETLPAFAAYLCEHTHVQTGTHSITLRRGANNERQSFLHLEFDKKPSSTLNIRIGGAVNISSKGEIFAI